MSKIKHRGVSEKTNYITVTHLHLIDCYILVYSESEISRIKEDVGVWKIKYKL